MSQRLLVHDSLFSRNALGDSNELGGEEFKLPKMASLTIVIVYNMMLQLSFFILIPSLSKYAEHLGGTATFSGTVIGIPALIAGIVLIPMTRYDNGRYATALHVGCLTGMLGHIIYAIAYRADYLYLILIGRCLNGISFTGFMYCKRWLVIGQALGMSLGPFLGGLLYKVGFRNSIFNGWTSPSWVMACCYVIFWLIIAIYFEDMPTMDMNLQLHGMTTSAPSAEEERQIGDLSQFPPSAGTARTSSPLEELLTAPLSRITYPQWGVIICMCWFAMLCFFILGSWEANLPVFGAATPALNWSPFAAGNFIALGGITAFPFFLASMLFARRLQDRHILAFGTCLGLSGLLVFISLLVTGKVMYGSLFACWWPIALGFNLATTVTLSLLSKQLPSGWNGHVSMAIQYSNYVGRITGAIWGGSGVAVGMKNFVGLEIGMVGIGGVLFTTLWRNLKTKTG